MVNSDILILGIGNVLMGDEGVGAHAITSFLKTEWPPNVELLDGGTGGFHLMAHIEAHDHVIMLDATMDGKPAGTIQLLKPKFSKDYPKALSSHDIGLKDMLESLQILEKLPEIHLFTISIEEIQPMKYGLSESVERVIRELEGEVRTLIKEINLKK